MAPCIFLGTCTAFFILRIKIHWNILIFTLFMTPLVHFEIMTDDLERAKKFYGDVFGWEFSVWKGENGPDGGPFEYTMIMTKVGEKGINGGMMKRNAPAPTEGTSANAFVCTMEVADYDATAAAILAGGGALQMPKMDMAGVGFLGYFKDTEGNLFGLMQPEAGVKM